MTDYPAEKITDLVAKTGRIDGMWSKEQIAAHALTLAIALKALAAERDTVAEEPEWEYRAVACEPDTGDIYNLTSRPASSERWARSDADLEEILHSDPDLPQLVLKVQCRRKAGPWVPVKQEGADQ